METGDKLESDVSGFRYEDRKDQGKCGQGIIAPVCSNTRDGSTKCSKKMLLSGDRIDSTAQPASHPVLMNKDKNQYRSPRKYV